MNSDFISFSVDNIYPLPFDKEIGAKADFLRSFGNRLVIYLPRMSSNEIKALSSGTIQAGLLNEAKNKGAIRWLFKFFYQNKSVLTLESPFDVRLIEKNDRKFYGLGSDERLVIEIYAIDENSILQVIRLISIPTELSILFLSAVQDQISSVIDGTIQQLAWTAEPTDVLFSKTKTWRLGT